MRKIFLAIAVLSFAAACVIIAGQKRIRQPFSRSSVWKSNSQNDRVISGVAFSPDGEKLIFLVYDESGPYHATQTYLYSLRDKTVRRLPTNGDGWVSGFLWSSDSIHVGFNRSKSRGY
jgi:Tol biopolymer transport system component